jgi:hypothetical protein
MKGRRTIRRNFANTFDLPAVTNDRKLIGVNASWRDFLTTPRLPYCRMNLSSGDFDIPRRTSVPGAVYLLPLARDRRSAWRRRDLKHLNLKQLYF